MARDARWLQPAQAQSPEQGDRTLAARHSEQGCGAEEAIASLSQALIEKNKVIDELEARNQELVEEAEGRARPLTVEEAVAALVIALKGEGASQERCAEVITDVAVRLGIAVEK